MRKGQKVTNIIPEFTAERRGAPIAAFLRWDETSPIHRRYKVHAGVRVTDV